MASKIYKNQTDFTIIVNITKSEDGVQSAQDLTGYTCTITYIKPESGATGSWPMTGYISRSSGIGYWKPASKDDLDEVGQYNCWVHTVAGTGEEADSTPFKFSVFEPGT